MTSEERPIDPYTKSNLDMVRGGSFTTDELVEAASRVGGPLLLRALSEVFVEAKKIHDRGETQEEGSSESTQGE